MSIHDEYISTLKHVEDVHRLTPEQLVIWAQNPHNVEVYEARLADLDTLKAQILDHHSKYTV